MKLLLKHISDIPPLVLSGLMFIFIGSIVIANLFEWDVLSFFVFICLLIFSIYYFAYNRYKYDSIITEFDKCLFEISDEYLKTYILSKHLKRENKDNIKENLLLSDICIDIILSEEKLDLILNRFQNIGLNKLAIKIILLEKALSHSLEAASLNPDLPETNFKIGKIYYYLYLYDNAKDYFIKAIDYSNDEVFYYLGLCDYFLNNLESAYLYFSSAIRINPDCKKAYYYRALVCSTFRDYTSALEDYSKFLEYENNNIEVLFFKGLLENKIGKYEDAINTFSNILKFEKNNVLALKERALTYYYSKNYEEALSDINKAILSNENQYDFYFVRGLIYQAINQPELSIQDFEHSIQLNPKNALSYYNLAIVVNEKGQKLEAIKHLDKALEIEPNYIEALEYRGKLKLEFGDLNGGKQDLDKASEYKVNYLGIANN